MITSERIPFGSRRRHKSVIRNNSNGGESIFVFVMSMSVWSAGLESVMAGAGAGVKRNVEVKFDPSASISSAAIRQVVVIPPGHSHWFEIPRVAGGSFFSRKAMVVIASEGEDPKMQLQAVVHLRSSTLLTVSLGPSSRTRGRVVVDTLTRENLISHDKANEQHSSPQADRSDTETAPASTCDTASNGESSPFDFVEVGSEDGGILSQIMRVIQTNLSASAAFPKEANTASTTCDGSNLKIKKRTLASKAAKRRRRPSSKRIPPRHLHATTCGCDPAATILTQGHGWWLVVLDSRCTQLGRVPRTCGLTAI
ncbi:expressed unknown protein [Ectocarpus siliculosus]|uniref:Uncharacterized protein n=1 Tax=Ectocarpus siliculosus TaxID=2880 RepID=D7G1B6_ECTSI|nr:expressed unknown protein [Ectocarpus siliculosus]|eukprot:CBJ33226.1 expressed unknown protein [Ectocarpus siliculosus]